MRSTFNSAFGELFDPKSPEYILKHSGPLLEYFGHQTEIQLQFFEVKPNEAYLGLGGGEVRVNLKYAGKKISKPHLFLNEARLSAIAISIYLGMIKRHIQGIPCKVLFLDDIFIGLDISNRLLMLRLLENEFTNYQIFITTYDKPWFEYAKSHLSGNNDWKTMEFFAKEQEDGSSIPMVFDNLDLLAKARKHLRHCDYKASAVYTRSAFEKIIQKYCKATKKKITFKTSIKDYTTEDFWKEVKKDLDDEDLIKKIEDYRPLILNTFSHHNTERHELKNELKAAIESIAELKSVLKTISNS